MKLWKSLCLFALLWWVGAVAGQEATAEPAWQQDIHEAVVMLPVSVQDRFGKTFSADMPLTTFHPDGDGPFPLVILNHGRAVSAEQRAQPARQRLEQAARYFVRKGFAVAVPTRLGYGQTAALGDPEDGGPCDRSQWQAAVQAGLTQLVATLNHMQAQPWVSTRRWLVVGQSAGGFLATAAASQHLPGLQLAINFAGGRGGDPERHPAVPCSPATLEKQFASWGQHASVPMLWVYTENDQFFGPAYTQAWFRAYQAAGGQAEYWLHPAFGNNGHMLFAAGNDLWQPLLDTYLAGKGWPQPGTMQPPPPRTDIAVGDDHSPVLLAAAVREEDYQRFLARPLPRAFVMDGHGHWGQASGDDALSRAMALCRNKGSRQCAFYAVNDQVVWPSH